MSKYTKKHEKQTFRKTKKQRGGINTSQNRRIAETVFTLRQKQKFRHALDEIKVLGKEVKDKSGEEVKDKSGEEVKDKSGKEVKDKSSKQLSDLTLTEKEMLDNYNNFCEQELAVVSIVLLKEDWRKNYDHLYENPSMPLPLSPLYKVPVAPTKEKGDSKLIKKTFTTTKGKGNPNDKMPNTGIILKPFTRKTRKDSTIQTRKVRGPARVTGRNTLRIGGYYYNEPDDGKVKKLINLFEYIVSNTGKNIKIRETVISRFMFILRLSSLRNSQTNWPTLNEAQLLSYTNAMILFITNNTSFNLFELLKVPKDLQQIPREEKNRYDDFVKRELKIVGLTPKIINKIKIYTGPDDIKINDLTSTPDIAFGKVGMVSALAVLPRLREHQRINDTYNTNTTIKDNLKDFLNGDHGESAPSNQKSQCVLLSVILYVISKISSDGVPRLWSLHTVAEGNIFDDIGNFNFNSEEFLNKTYTSSKILYSVHDVTFEDNSLKNIYTNVCKSDNNAAIPYNTLISFNINPNNTYVHKSFVSSIKPVVKELIYDIFSTLRLNNSGITLPINIPEVEMGNNIITYKRDELTKSDSKFLQTSNIRKLGNTNYITAQYETVDHEIINDAIPNYTSIDSSLNDVLVPDFSLNRVLVSSICNTVSTMSYLVYLPTYHVATYNFGDANLQYFGAYDPDPDCIKLTNVPQLTFNNEILRELEDRTEEDRTDLDKRLIENYKYSYHRIHVWLNKPSRLIYFAIRGTHSSRDWQHSDYLVARGEGHRMDRVDIIDDVLRQVYSDMGGIWGLGNNTAKEKYKLIITGHSLGGNLTNITKVLTHKNRLYEFKDTFTNGFPISCQPYYSSGDNSDEHFKILNFAFSQDKGLVLNVEHDGAAELLITKKNSNRISKNLVIFQVSRTTKQIPLGGIDNYLLLLDKMKFTHSLYNFFGKRTWENIMNHHTQQKLLITDGDVIDTTNACIGRLIRHSRDNEGVAERTELSYIKYGDYEFDSDKPIETESFILTTNLAINTNCRLPIKDVDV